MKTYWQYDVHFSRPDGSCGGSSGVGDNLANAISRGYESAIYYAAYYPANGITIEVKEYCSKCHNDGFVSERRKRSPKVVKCPDCKGKPPTGHIGPMALQ